MKTLTEISGSVIRAAAAAIAEARRSLQTSDKPAEAAVAAPAPQPAEGAVADVAGGAAPSTPPTAPAVAPTTEREEESEVVKAALDEAVAKATGYSGDRLAMLRAAVQAAGRRSEDVRLVRVFARDEELRGAQVIGERQYVVDLFPPSMKQDAGAGKDERDRGGRRGGGRGGGARGAKGSTSGGFSMDSVREDRRNERGGGRGRPGGGRRPGGGGAGGGPTGAPPGGDPKR